MKRPVLGILVNINSILDSYQLTIWKGVRDAARESGVRLVSFSGGVLDSPYGFESQNNVVYDLVAPENVDAVISLTASICNYTGNAGVERICQIVKGRPVVHLGAIGNTGASILTDNTAGIHTAMDHLIAVHGRRRIAHISGTAENTEAIDRLNAYRASLERHGIPFDPDLVVPGDFRRDRGHEAIATLIDQRKVEFDAILSANDAMALGALDALTARGISVPRQVSLISFDDLAEACHSTPPLTTIRQPLYRQGCRAVEIALEMLDSGSTGPQRENLAAQLVVRQSCGCREAAVLQGAEDGALSKEQVAAELETLLLEPGKLTESGARTLATQLVGMRDAPTEEFLDRIDFWLRAAQEADLAPEECCRAFLLLRRSLPLAERSAQEHRYHQALIAACTSNDRQRSASMRTSNILNHEQRTTGQRLLSTMDLPELVGLVNTEFRIIRIRRFWMAFHEDPAEPTGLLRLVCGYDENGDFDPSSIPPYPASQIIPDGVGSLPEDAQILVEALFHREQQIGFLAFERSHKDETGPILLREHLASAIRGALLVKQKEERATELAQALKILHDNQEQLLKQEKMATLGRMTAGIAHEMNTPLAALRSAVSEAMRLSKEYSESAADPDVTPQDHLDISAELSRALDVANRAAEKAAAYVQGIKGQTRDIGFQERVAFDLRTPISEAILLLGFALRHANCEMETLLPDTPCPFRGNAGHIQQIVTNLVNNALDAMDGRSGKRIVLDLAQTGDEYVLSIRDNGCGIPAEHLSRIFEMLFTTKPSGRGTGLGLSIVSNLVGGLGGHVDVQSTENEGTCFEIRLPGGKG